MTRISKLNPQSANQSLFLSIISRKKITGNIYELNFSLENEEFLFVPGQYIHITLPSLIHHDPRGNSRIFTITSSPGDPYLSIAVKTSNSGFKKTLLSKKIKAGITGPYGIFTLPQLSNNPVVFIAEDIGITPFLSMMRYLTIKNLSQKVILIYKNKSLKTVPFLRQLKKLGKLNSNLNLNFIRKSLTPEYIDKILPDAANTLFYICGAPDMVVQTQIMLSKMHISQNQIMTEKFVGINSETSKESERISLENEMEHSTHLEIEALLQALSNSAVVSETNAEGTITFVNDMFVEISKYSKEELIGQNHRILKSGLHTNEFYENLWATISRGKIWRGVLKNKAKDGTFYWVDSSIAPIVGKDGKPSKYISVRFLVTERQQAEEALKEKVRQQNALAILSQEALANTDLGHIFDSAVTLLKKTLNIDQAAVMKLLPGNKSLIYESGIGFENAIKGKSSISADGINTMAGFTLSSNQPTIVHDLTTESRFRGSGILHDHFARSGINVIIQGSDNPYGILQVYSTKKREFSESDINFVRSVANLLANAARNQLDKRKDEFLGIASHEIKTPLTSIKTFAQLLQKHAQKQNDQQSILFLSRIDQQINRMSKLISDLLDISRINSGKVDFEDENFRLDEVTREIVNEIQLITQKHKIILNNRFNNIVYGDKNRIGQVLTNLLTNAVKFSPESDKIIVNTQHEKGKAIVSIQDFGIGIPKKEQDFIFGRFYKGNDFSKKHMPGGLGLGLYISLEIIKRHKGEMWVNSTEGKGSTFYFSLPLKNTL